jgi:hypothetical protein
MKQRDQRKQRRKKEPKPLKRLLHFPDGEVWSWRYMGPYIRVREPDNVTDHNVPVPDITGMTWDDMERGEWKGWWKGIGPQEIKDYITLHLRPDPEFPVPHRVFVHSMFGRGSRWHLYGNCYFLGGRAPNLHFGTVLASELAERIGAPATRLNLCGVCMHKWNKERNAA